MLNLNKFCLRYFKLKTNDIFQKIISSSSFSLSIILVNSSANSKIRDTFEICLSRGFQNCHWLLKLMKTWLRYLRLKARLNFQKVSESMNLTSSVAKYRRRTVYEDADRSVHHPRGLSSLSGGREDIQCWAHPPFPCCATSA